jgi:hypothetical protein
MPVWCITGILAYLPTSFMIFMKRKATLCEYVNAISMPIIGLLGGLIYGEIIGIGIGGLLSSKISPTVLVPKYLPSFSFYLGIGYMTYPFVHGIHMACIKPSKKKQYIDDIPKEYLR